MTTKKTGMEEMPSTELEGVTGGANENVTGTAATGVGTGTVETVQPQTAQPNTAVLPVAPARPFTGPLPGKR